MGACASVPKSMRAEAADVPAPEPAKEEIPATTVAVETTVAAEAEKEEVTPEKKVEDGDDKHENKAVEVEAPKEAAVEVESEKLKAEEAPVKVEPAAAAAEEEEEKKTHAEEAPAKAEPAAATTEKEEEKKTQAVEQK